MTPESAAAVAPHLKPGRKATWFELFFDLAFVTAVAQITATLAEHYDAAGMLRGAFLLLLLWWTWLGHTFHATRFDEDRPGQQRLGMLQIAAVVLIAYGAGDAFGERAAAFAAGMAALKLLLMVAYFRERSRPAAAGLVRTYASVYALQALLWLASAALHGAAQWALWAAVLAVDLASPMLVARHTHGYPPHPEHLPERFGLFTIIVMGEGVASTLHARLHAGALSAYSAALALLGLALAYLYWVGYFARAGAQHELEVRDAAGGRRLRHWAYGHIPLLVGLAGGAAGLVAASGHHAGADAAWVAGGSITLAMLGLTAIGSARAALRGDTRRRWPNALLALVPLASGAAGSIVAVYAVGGVVGVAQVLIARRPAGGH